ncbi:MAG TPA: hypothetical protein VKY19_16795 [Ktedonosporobacter sp.]|jgi:hypothetical protein|nr:hypothetical protein [Ktedonosporobacter sp.]
MSEYPEGLIPQVPFAITDLEGMERVVWAYCQYLQKPPVSPKNVKQLQTLQPLQKRLEEQLASETKEVQIFLNLEELEELLQAMLDFITLIRRLFPKNQERETVVESVNVWRLRLIHIMSEFDV